MCRIPPPPPPPPHGREFRVDGYQPKPEQPDCRAFKNHKLVGPSNSEIKRNLDNQSLMLCSALFFFVGLMVGGGFILYLSSNADPLARCNSMNGDYGNGKCYVNGVEK